ncbi:MAG TPA: YCF48-related protein [Blastocatellia bacterium]|nr:YCF48-related protein [Blastocatellia bacterium]
MKSKLPLVLLILFSVSCNHGSKAPIGEAHWDDGPRVGSLDLLGVSFADDLTGLIVGDISPAGEGGAIYKTADGGRTWRAIAHTPEILTSVCLLDAKRAWVAGYGGRIERTDDGGQTWKTQRTERDGEMLNSIFFIDDRHGWAAGGSGLLLRTSNGGDSWEPVSTRRVEDLWAVRFSSADAGWAVGEDGLILRSSDGGRTWAPQTSSTNKALMGLTVSADGVAVAVGASGTVLINEAGEQWRPVEAPTTESLNAVSSGKTRNLWVVGSRGVVIGSTDSGRTWAKANNISGDLASVDESRAGRGIAVGKQGTTRLLPAQ